MKLSNLTAFNYLQYIKYTSIPVQKCQHKITHEVHTRSINNKNYKVQKTVFIYNFFILHHILVIKPILYNKLPIKTRNKNEKEGVKLIKICIFSK